MCAIHLHTQAQQLLDVQRQLSTTEGLDPTVHASSASDALKVELGMAIRRLKQHWHLGATCWTSTTKYC